MSTRVRTIQLPDGGFANAYPDGRVIRIAGPSQPTSEEIYEESDERTYYELSLPFPAITAEAPFLQLLNPGRSSVNVALVRLEIVMTQAVQSNFGLIYVEKDKAGVPLTSSFGLDTLPATGSNLVTPSSKANLVTAWTTPPSLNTTYLRRQACGSYGETVVWSWDPEGSNGPPLIIPQGGSVILREPANLVTGTFYLNVRWQEQRLGQTRFR